MKNKKSKTYNARILVMGDGSIKVTKAELKVGINQHRDDWEVCNSRQLARFLRKNKDKIITK